MVDSQVSDTNQQLAFLQTNGDLTNESQGHIFVDVQAKDKFYFLVSVYANVQIQSLTERQKWELKMCQ